MLGNATRLLPCLPLTFFMTGPFLSCFSINLGKFLLAAFALLNVFMVVQICQATLETTFPLQHVTDK